ncbi:dTMP kinase [Tumebacillus permanentifrigoris]|uniref:Thymidylate kinase n=1 Tax=Tumebacillus permanentifrigoris TaxID=378543 RepID=A0A316D4X6_9BACL|nr:dTMP kinase [Tumebacillus permanentifrigoris]PWK07955.1 dTMP kinase [Tumebacillus permanentifrigoris]
MGLFITLEGPDGSGKSTQIRRLAERLGSLGIQVHTTREPGGTPISDQIRAMLLDPENSSMVAKTEMLLYAASRAQHVAEVIRPNLAAGRVILCDRYIDASLAYQATGLGIPLEQVRQINEHATDGLWPTRTYLIDVPSELGLQRAASGRGKQLDRIEQRDLDYHRRVREQFLQIASQESERIVVIDGTQSIDAVTEAIWQDIRQFL